MTKKEALERGRKFRDEKLFRRLYEENKANINKDHFVGYEAFKARVEKAWGANPKYEDVKSLTSAGRKMLHTLEFIDKDTIALENIKEGLKSMKTGRTIKWGKRKVSGIKGGLFEYEQPTKEETMFDVFRRLIGIGNKFNIWWDADSKTYRFIGQDGLEYEIITKTSPVKMEIQLVNA